MFGEEVLNKIKALEEQWQRDCAELYKEREFKEMTTGHARIPLKPVYTPLDIANIDFEDIGLPGEYPYTRGTNLRGYQAQPWMMRIGFGFGAGKDTRERWEHLRKVGMRLHIGTEQGEEEFPKFNILHDLPSQRGYDPDHPEAQGKVGQCGISVSTVRDMELLCEGLPLDKINITFIVLEPSLVFTAMYVTYAERQGYPPEVLRMETPHWPYGQWFCDVTAFPPENALKLMVENINYRIKHMPLTHHTSITGYNPGEAGANPIQEIAFLLAFAIEITEACVKAGLDPDDIAPRYYYHAHFGIDLFEGIAKLRAQRRMWAKVFKNRFGCKKPQSLKVVAFPQTSGLILSAQEPLNNVIRSTITTLGLVLAGVDGVWTSSYDEAYCIPSEEAAQIAVRTQQILYHETNIPSVVDPLGGSYYLEWLTNKMEEESWKLLEEVEKRGGAFKCWETGWLRRELERSANEWHASFRQGEKVMVGVNKYRLEEESCEIEVFEVDPGVEEEAIARVRRFREERDNQKVKEALAELTEVTERFIEEWPKSCGTLMPAILNAARANCTLGEMQGVLKEVCGHGYTY